MESDAVTRLLALSTCHAVDAMDELGLPRSGLVGIVPLEPAVKMAGPAFNVAYEEASEPRGEGDYLEVAPAGSVAVLAAGGRVDCSVWGGKRSLTGMRKGLAGALADGAYRDVHEQRLLGFPVYGRGRTNMGSKGQINGRPTSEPVTIAGVVISPGDLIYGDESGVVVIPRARVGEVVTRAEAVAASEDYITEAIEKVARERPDRHGAH